MIVKGSGIRNDYFLPGDIECISSDLLPSSSTTNSCRFDPLRAETFNSQSHSQYVGYNPFSFQ